MEYWQVRLRQRDAEWGDLMRAARNGDATAYNRLLTRLAPALRSVTRRGLVRAGMSVEDAEDVVQEILLAIHLKRETWDPSLPFGPWLHAIARNKLIDAMRRRGRHNKVSVSIDDVAETLASDAEEPAPVPGTLDQHLKNLPDRQRSVVVAISVDGASIAETAKRLEMSQGAVRVALHRGLTALAAKFGRPNA